jgi:multiple sugar transport system permease protein
MAFQDHRLILPSRWIGVENFSRALFSVDFWKALLHSVQYCLLSLGLGFFTPIGLALLLHEVPRGKIFFRTVYYLPAVTTGSVIFVLWGQLYDPSPNGVLNQLLAAFHIAPRTFTNDPKLAMLCCIIPTIWAGVGPGCIIYLAGLRAIPEELYQAADLDGCGFFGKLFNITYPYLRALVIINFVGAFIAGFKSFDTIFILTGGGPVGATKVLGMEIWYNAYLYLKYGYAAAMAWILGSLLIGFTIVQLRILSRLEYRTASAQG